MGKYLLFLTQRWTAANVDSNVPRLFFFSTWNCPLDTTQSVMGCDASYRFPLQLALTQATTNVTAPTMTYKASTFRLRLYKAYMRMINIALSKGKYN